MAKKLTLREDPDKLQELITTEEESKIDLSNPITIAALEEAKRLAYSPEQGYTNMKDFWRDLLDN